MHARSPQDPASADTSSEVRRRAFRELHAPSLHGFALLLTLGDRRRALALTADALSMADAHAAELRHPERAAAWLRRRVTVAAGRRESAIDTQGRLDALEPLNVTPPVLAGLSALGRLERAALVSSWIERLDVLDVATIVDRTGDRLDALLHRARQRYLLGCSASEDRPAWLGGPIADRVRTAAARALA